MLASNQEISEKMDAIEPKVGKHDRASGDSLHASQIARATATRTGAAADRIRGVGEEISEEAGQQLCPGANNVGLARLREQDCGERVHGLRFPAALARDQLLAGELVGWDESMTCSFNKHFVSKSFRE